MLTPNLRSRARALKVNPPVARPRYCASMRTRLTFLVATLGIAVVAVACGRASQADIDSALGITPTATLSADQIATGTANAALAQSSGGTVGDVAQGRIQYQLRCLNCHRPNNAVNAPVLSGPDNPAVALTDEQLITLIRTGEGHSTPP